jgi:hypothetical protein
MKNIILFIKNILAKNEIKKPILGRWNMESCNKKINNKIDLANEDHCGPCGTYINKKVKIMKTQLNKSNTNVNY